MRTRTTLAATGIALGLVVAGAAAANATQTPDGWSPSQWTHRVATAVTDGTDPTGMPMGYGPWGDGTAEQGGYGPGMLEGGTGDPTTCPFADEDSADRLQDRDRDRLLDGSGAVDRQQMRDRVHATT